MVSVDVCFSLAGPYRCLSAVHRVSLWSPAVHSRCQRHHNVTSSTRLQTADLCSLCVLGCSRTRSRPAAGHLDSAGMSRCLPVKCGCRGLTCAPPVYFSIRPPWRQQNMCTASAVQHVWERRGTASSSLLQQRPPSSGNWPITTSGDSSSEAGADGTRTGFLTEGAGLGIFQPIRNKASGHPLQFDEG